jgi:hypothetical protein
VKKFSPCSHHFPYNIFSIANYLDFAVLDFIPESERALKVSQAVPEAVLADFGLVVPPLTVIQLAPHLEFAW